MSIPREDGHVGEKGSTAEVREQACFRWLGRHRICAGLSHGDVRSAIALLGRHSFIPVARIAWPGSFRFRLRVTICMKGCPVPFT